MTENNNRILFRNETYGGEGVCKPARVIEYEIFELGNGDIPLTIAEHYASDAEKKEIEDTLNGFRESEEAGDGVAGWDKENFAVRLLEIVEKATGRKIKSVLWLAERKSVIDNYEGGSPYARINAYPTSDIVLSDLGEEGCLFAYETKPERIDTED